MITEQSLYELEKSLKKDFVGEKYIGFNSDTFDEYLNEHDTEELRLCRISATEEDVYFFFCMAYDEDDPKPEDEVLAIEVYFNSDKTITDIAVYGK